jgi:hypothetical protein
MTVRALLVAIDDYRPPVNPLRGCRNDIDAFEAMLHARVGGDVGVVRLVDREATREAIVEAFRGHLGTSVEGDVALFFFSGHGSEEPAPAELAHLEPSGKIQLLVCSDTGQRVAGRLRRGIADKELAVLITDVAARGAHVVVILDCCHSGGGTRDDMAVTVRQWLPELARPSNDTERALLAELAAPRQLDEFLMGGTRGWQPTGVATGEPTRSMTMTAGPTHVALSACRSDQVAKEMLFDGVPRGAFSVALTGALEGLGPTTTTYRSLLAATGSRVRRSTGEQDPVIYPTAAGGPADGVFLGGAIEATTPSYLVTRAASGWQLDAGAMHGLRAPRDGEAFTIACLTDDDRVAGLMRVESVEPGCASVEPIEWSPDGEVYQAVVVGVPMPMATVRFDRHADGADAYALVRAALATSGPAGGPSVDVRVVDDVDRVDLSESLVLRVAAFRDGYDVERTRGVGVSTDDGLHVPGPCFRVLRADGTPVAADVGGLGPESASEVVDILEHVARWEAVRALGDHESRLRDAVAIDVFVARDGEDAVPSDRVPDVSGASLSLVYRAGESGWEAPKIFLRLRNTTDRPLFAALVTFTDDYSVSTALMPETARLAPGHAFHVWDGMAIPAEIPDGRPVVPGATAHDWLKLFVSDDDFDVSAFALGALSQPAWRDAPAPGDPRTWSTLTRIAARATARSAVDAGPVRVAAEWASVTLAVTTVVPHPT